nr:putative RNA-directed DNA polymerase [Tanacetum cinerariifolium]
VAAGPTLEDNPFAQADNDPFVNVFALEPSFDESSSRDVSSTESTIVVHPHNHLGKWSKDHPLDNVIDNPYHPISTRKQLATDALWCLYNSMDVKIAFLNGELKEEVYVSQPEGFNYPDQPTHVYRVKNAIYGLKQAPRAWCNTLSRFLLDNKFSKGVVDPTLFTRKTGKHILLVQIYDTAMALTACADADHAGCQYARRNKMTEENLPAPTRSVEQLVPANACLPYGKSNLLFDLEKLQKNLILHISVDILQNTNFFRAFSASANVPSIYIPQFWNTLTQEAKTEITPINPANQFVSPSAGEIVMDFVNKLGYPEVINFASDMHVNNLYQPTNVDYAELLWKEFVQGIQTFFTQRDSNKIPSKKPISHVIPYCRFTKLIIYYLESKYGIHRRPGSPRHVTGDDFLLGNLKSEYFKQYIKMAARKVQAKESCKKKTASKADKPVKPAPAKQSKSTTSKQPKPKPVKANSAKPTSP